LGLNEGFPIWLNKLCILAQCIIREIPPTGHTRIKKVSRVSAGSHITGHLSITLPCLFDIGKSSKERLVRQVLMLIDFQISVGYSLASLNEETGTLHATVENVN